MEEKKDKTLQDEKIVKEVPERESTKKVNLDKKKKGIFAGASLLILLIIMIVVFVTMQAQKKNTSDEIPVSTETTADCGNNTTLSSGTVAAKIDNRSITYNAAYVVDGIDATICSGTYESTSDDQVVFLVINGGSLKIDGDVTIKKSGSENFQGRGDNYSFYGTNSAIAVVGEGSSASINGVTITTDVSGANAIVATNSGEVLIEDSEISTTKDNSRGLHATYKGSINADNVKISTQGGSCASLATDRGEGTVVANNMTLATAGAGSPLIYSTGDITVSNSTGTATGAQIAVVEGKNSITLDGCEFSANGNGNRKNVDNAGVMIYQSMSGDAGEGTGSFSATDCTLKVLADSSVYNETPFFFVTNTNAKVELTDVKVEFSEAATFVSAVSTTEWGRSGRNGGKVAFTISDLTATNKNTEVDDYSSISGI